MTWCCIQSLASMANDKLSVWHQVDLYLINTFGLDTVCLTARVLPSLGSSGERAAS
jgi:hypothetical protein